LLCNSYSKNVAKLKDPGDGPASSHRSADGGQAGRQALLGPSMLAGVGEPQGLGSSIKHRDLLLPVLR